ncbi:hypothetical protein [Streptomyces sp. DH24]|uniref:hypothetical protein n=1 Tax=Streptomyces sp. DH24 TaxID=3040123 RepID=UPI002441966D|nr:hypothetical protein [Streptomyces sp. DH24]MDG9715542.1 hypothetical protein [Streptomyces sp. DH24]
MSDPTAGRPGGPTPDFLDRLLARHAPVAAARADVARVRPRLPGPFERIEAVRGRDADRDGTEPLWPVTAPLTERREEAARPTAREVLRTERERTVVRTEQAPAPDTPAPRPAAPPLPETPLLRPVTPLTPGLRPVPDTGRRSAGRGRAEPAPAPSAVSVPSPPGTDTASRATGPAAPRPSAADTAAARDAVRQASARRTGRGGEQVVQVQIGRLEVTAAEPARGGGQHRPRQTGRPQATVSLADYLARGRE